MKRRDWLEQAAGQLAQAGIGTARLDSLILLEDATGKDRAHLLAHDETALQPAQLKRLNRQLAARAKHVPLAYVRGFVEFYGRRFIVNKNVLVPRPETETMIDMTKALSLRQATVADVGSGSGCIGITLKLELPAASVDLLDNDPKTLAVARQNARRLKAEVEIIKSDLLAHTARAYDVIVANLPYVPDHYYVNEAARNEPRSAIYGGSDGLDLYRRLFEEIAKNLQFFGVRYVLTESLPPQHQALRGIASAAGFGLLKTDDFIQLFSRREPLPVSPSPTPSARPAKR